MNVARRTRGLAIGKKDARDRVRTRDGASSPLRGRKAYGLGSFQQFPPCATGRRRMPISLTPRRRHGRRISGLSWAHVSPGALATPAVEAGRWQLDSLVRPRVD